MTRSRMLGRPGMAAISLAAATLAAVSVTASAADNRPYPQRPVRIVAAQQAGSATDNVARLVADALEAHWGVAVTVENRPGAGGTIGAEAAARVTRVGYTLLVGGTSNLVIAAATEPELRYDPPKDFVPVGRFAHVPFAFAVNPEVPAHSLRELADLARAQPGKLTYATVGPTTSSGFGMAMFLSQAGIDMLPVEYKGITSALPDMLSGRVNAIFNEVAVLSVHSGKLRVLAVASPRRVARLPDVPTTAEAGYPGVVIAPWYGLLAPAGTPPEVLQRLGEAYEAAMRSPTTRKRIDALGYVPIDDMPGQFASALREDIAAIRAIARRSASAAPR